MATRPRTDSLTTTALYNLDQACWLLRRAFDATPYLVGTAASGDPGYRDVDVRLILDDDEYAAVCPNQQRWELLCLAIGTWLAERTGLPVDFQIQRREEANERYPEGVRNPLGMKRTFAGGGMKVIHQLQLVFAAVLLTGLAEWLYRLSAGPRP